MNSILQITLGVVTAMGGFIDIGELVFAVQSGVKFGFSLIWAIIIGTIGIILFSEQSGRITAITRKPLYLHLKERLPKKLTLLLLILSTLLCVITCAAEFGGVVIAVQLLTGLSFYYALFITIGSVICLIWLLPFEALEKIFGILGCFMLVFIAALFAVHVPLNSITQGIIPTLPKYNDQSIFVYLYFAIGIISSTMMPYELFFYSSGGIEEKWSPKDLFNNRMTSGLGMSFGASIALTLLALGAHLLKPMQITPQLHGTSAFLAAIPFGKTGIIIAILGIIFTLIGATIENCLSGAYIICQHFDWSWGRHKKPLDTLRFTGIWIAILIFSLFVLLFQIDPVQLVEYAVIFSVLIMPCMYYVILTTSSDKQVMKKNATGIFGKILGWFYVLLITAIAIAAIPLMIITSSGNG